MKNMIRCEACGKATPGYDIVNYTPRDDVCRQLCNQCYNKEVAKHAGAEYQKVSSDSRSIGSRDTF